MEELSHVSHSSSNMLGDHYHPLTSSVVTERMICGSPKKLSYSNKDHYCPGPFISAVTIFITSSSDLPSNHYYHIRTTVSASLEHPVSSSISIMTPFALLISSSLIPSLLSSLLFKTGFCYVMLSCLELVIFRPQSPPEGYLLLMTVAKKPGTFVSPLNTYRKAGIQVSRID